MLNVTSASWGVGDDAVVFFLDAKVKCGDIRLQVVEKDWIQTIRLISSELNGVGVDLNWTASSRSQRPHSLLYRRHE